jgi:hypothetical protein
MRMASLPKNAVRTAVRCDYPSGEWQMENGHVTKWEMENGEMANGNGKWEMENGRVLV